MQTITLDLLNLLIINYTEKQRIDLYQKIFKINCQILNFDCVYNINDLENINKLDNLFNKNNFKHSDQNYFDNIDDFYFTEHFTSENIDLINIEDLKIIFNIETTLNDILNSDYLSLKTLKVLTHSNNVFIFDKKSNKLNLILDDLISRLIIKLSNSHEIPEHYFDNFFLKSFQRSNMMSYFDYILSYNNICLMLLISKKISVECLCKLFLSKGKLFEIVNYNLSNQVEPILTDTFIKNYLNSYIKTFSTTLNITLNNKQYNLLFSILEKNLSYIDYLDPNSLKMIVDHLASFTKSFQNQIVGTNKIKQNNLNYTILLKFLFSDLDPSKILETYKKIDENIKMKDVFCYEENKLYFVEHLNVLNTQVLKTLCEFKGVTITKYCINHLIDKFNSENSDEYYNNKNYCINFVLIIDITLDTICEMIGEKIICKIILTKIIEKIIVLHNEILNDLNLIFVDSLDLYNVISEYGLPIIGLKILKEYLKTQNEIFLESYPVNVISQIILPNIDVVEIETLLTLLNNTYKENENNDSEIHKLDNLLILIKKNIEKYDKKYVSNFIIRLMTSGVTYSKVFLTSYFNIVPDVKSHILEKIFSKIYVELKLQKQTSKIAKILYPEENFKLENPLVELYEKLIVKQKPIDNEISDTDDKKNNNETILINLNYVHNPIHQSDQTNQTNQVDKNNLETNNLETNYLDIDVETIDAMLNCKNVTNYYLDKHVCKICFTQECQTTLYPCGHLLCEKCFYSYVNLKKKCPFCSANVSPIKMFFI